MVADRITLSRVCRPILGRSVHHLWAYSILPLSGVAVRFRTAVIIAFALIIEPAVVAQSTVFAQPRSLDVGSFTIFENGQRVGREQFSIVQTRAPANPATIADGSAVAASAFVPESLGAGRTGSGGNLELRAESSVGDRRKALRLDTDSSGSPLSYAVEIRTGAAIALRLSGQRVRGRFATVARVPHGESAREYLFTDGEIILEAEDVHQYSMLVRNRRIAVGDSVRIATLSPTDNRQGYATLTLETATDTVTIAGSRRRALRWLVVTDAGERRTLWSDDRGRVFRLLIPSRGFEAIRDDLPPG